MEYRCCAKSVTSGHSWRKLSASRKTLTAMYIMVNSAVNAFSSLSLVRLCCVTWFGVPTAKKAHKETMIIPLTVTTRPWKSSKVYVPLKRDIISSTRLPEISVNTEAEQPVRTASWTVIELRSVDDLSSAYEVACTKLGESLDEIVNPV